MSMNELPLWIQASYVLFYSGVFIVGCCIASWLLTLIPPVYRYLDRLTDDSYTEHGVWNYDVENDEWTLLGGSR